MPETYPLFEDKFPTPSVVGVIVMLSLECISNFYLLRLKAFPATGFSVR